MLQMYDTRLPNNSHVKIYYPSSPINPYSLLLAGYLSEQASCLTHLCIETRNLKDKRKEKR